MSIRLAVRILGFGLLVGGVSRETQAQESRLRADIISAIEACDSQLGLLKGVFRRDVLYLDLPAGPDMRAYVAIPLSDLDSVEDAGGLRFICRDDPCIKETIAIDSRITGQYSETRLRNVYQLPHCTRETPYLAEKFGELLDLVNYSD